MSPTFDVAKRFQRDWSRLTATQQEAFRKAVATFVADLRTGRFRKALRVKGIKGASGVFEMTGAPDGRATFEFGDSIHEGEPHVIWRRVGTHEIFSQP